MTNLIGIIPKTVVIFGVGGWVDLSGLKWEISFRFLAVFVVKSDTKNAIEVYKNAIWLFNSPGSYS